MQATCTVQRALFTSAMLTSWQSDDWDGSALQIAKLSTATTLCNCRF